MQARLNDEKNQRHLENTELNERDLQKRQLEGKMEEATLELDKLAEEKRHKEEENLVLISEIQELKYRIENGSILIPSSELSFPQNEEQE